MSISPQSLAKTRDKRSLRKPDKFKDFEDEYIPGNQRGNYAAALRLKSKPSSTKRHLSLSGSTSADVGQPAKKVAATPEAALVVQPAKSSRPPPRQRSSTPASGETLKESPSTPSPTLASSTTSSSSSASTSISSTTSASQLTPTTNDTTISSIAQDTSNIQEPDLNNSAPPPPQAISNEPKQSQAQTGKETISCSKNNQDHLNETPSTNVLNIDLECKETAPVNIETEITKADSGARIDLDLEVNVKKEVESSQEVAMNSTVDERTVDLAAENVDKSFLNSLKRTDDNVIKKSPFHPSITISNGVRLGGTTAKPLTEKKPATVSILSTTQPIVPKSSSTNTSTLQSSSSARKRSRGFSLMAKPTTNTANGIAAPTTTTTNNHSFQNNTNRAAHQPQVHVQQQQQQQQQQQLQQPQPTKYFNNLAQNMQYGTRLMLNEPIYLPKSVPTIEPLRTGLLQIANQARRPPLLSEKGQRYFAYQEERKLSIPLSNHASLIRVTKFLDVKDLLNLRLVNRTWKSVIDCDEVWKKVSLKGDSIPDWQELFEQVLKRRKTRELNLEQFEQIKKVPSIASMIAHSSIKNINIKTVNAIQNRSAMELIVYLKLGIDTTGEEKQYESNVRVNWKVQVVVDDSGLALVPCAEQDEHVLDLCQNRKLRDLIIDEAEDHIPVDADIPIQVQLSTIKTFFDGLTDDVAIGPTIYVEAI